MAAPTVSQAMPAPPDGEGGDPSLHLLAIGPDQTINIRLPAEGDLLIGRAEDAPVRIVDPQASRSHARLRISAGGALEVEDLGSANGTYVREERIPAGARMAIVPGDVVAIGSTVLMVQRRRPGISPRLLWPHGYLESRLIEECARAAKVRGSFALARVDLEPDASAEAAEEVLGATLRAGDLLAAWGPRQYELLLVDSGAAQAEALLDRIAAALTARGIAARQGVAFYPTHATSPQELFTRAAERVRGTGGDAPRGTVLANPEMRRLYALAGKVAVGTINILITGETGVGKEILAQAIHKASPRADKPLVALNCGALSESLLESELFGHERGAFTGALQAKEGLFEAASGGTLFLDEVGEMPPALQTRMLRVLETREVLRVGSTRPRPVDVRVIAATNRDLEEEVAQKTFRQDLYFRLGGVTLAVPPLRERSDEIDPLARLFLEAAARPLGRPVPAIAAEALALLRAYPWPGNIRELRNVMERALLLVVDGPITREHLPTERMERAIARVDPAVSPPPHARLPDESPQAWRDRVSTLERQAIVDALARCAGNKTRAAELLGMGRTTFFARLKEYKI